MRRMTAVLSLIVAVASAADEGAAKPIAKGERDSGAGGTSGAKVKPVLLLAETAAVIERYSVAKPNERSAIKGVLSKLTVGRRASAAILVEHYQLPFSRRVDLTADVVITDPTGRVVLDRAGIAGAQTMDPKTMVLLPLGPPFGMMFGLTDPEGEYRARVTVWDQVRGTSSVLETKFLVTR